MTSSLSTGNTHRWPSLDRTDRSTMTSFYAAETAKTNGVDECRLVLSCKSPAKCSTLTSRLPLGVAGTIAFLFMPTFPLDVSGLGSKPGLHLGWELGSVLQESSSLCLCYVVRILEGCHGKGLLREVNVMFWLRNLTVGDVCFGSNLS
jgi:hypothetical protein